ncbi:hypothetical protein ABFX02_04G081100 [Erythranthe guttata]
MLQWMGGSRRKVTTSRKSTQKRQKQYFEQRKRQQQQIDGLESYADGKRSCTQHCEYNRSLDILSLENISIVAQEHQTSCINARDESENEDCTSNHQYALPSLEILTDEDTHVDQSEITEERTLPRYGKEAEYSKKVSVHLPDHNEDFVGNKDKLDPFKLSTKHHISVIDMLGDAGANSNAEENSVHVQEAHVSFSVEGLGKVGTETPVHSPKIPGRSFPNGFSMPRKATRQPITSKHLDFGIHDLESQVGQDAVMQDIQFSPYGSSTEQPFRSRDTMNIVDDPYDISLNFTNPSSLNWDGSNLHGDFANDEPIYSVRDSGRNIWNGGAFLDDSINDVGLGEYVSFRKNRVDKRNCGYDDYFHNKDPWKQDFSFEGWNRQKKSSSTRGTEIFDMRESPVPYTKHQIAKDLPDDIILDTRWYPGIEIDNDVKSTVNRYARDDNRDSLSLRSEESCSSTAVRGDAADKS